jgi:hypothetical protein
MATNSTKARPVPKRKPVRAGTSRPAGLLTWVTIGVIAAVILAIVVVKVTSTSVSATPWTPATPTVVTDLTTIPTSVFNEIGINTGGVVAASAPHAVPGLTELNWKMDGKARPTIYYYGAEFCPYCAAERWPMIIALSRFGKFTDLGNMQSSSTDRYANTQTFTFQKATYSSAYINFFSTEGETNTGQPLQTPTATELTEIDNFDTSKYYPALGAGSSSDGTIPFISFNNQLFQIGASYSPSTLVNLTRGQIATAIAAPDNYLGKGIIVVANLLTATICQIDGQQPSSVCQSSGVRAADTAMKLRT